MYAHLDFENYEKEELCSLFETKVALKRLRVLYPEMKIIGSVLLLMILYSNAVGEVVENLMLFI